MSGFSSSAVAAGAPSAWVMRWLAGLPAGASVLDVAAGSGRHALAAVELGLRVTAVDRDVGGLLAAGTDRLTVRQVDLEQGPWPFGDESFDAVLVSRYLFRPRLALLAALVAPGGRLIYETFARGNERYGRPSNPAFLLEAGELYERARRAGLVVLGYEHGFVSAPAPAMIQRVCALRPPLTEPLLALG